MDKTIIKAILIDDTESYIEEFKGLASYHYMEVLGYISLENALDEYPDLSGIDFIILDAQGIIDEEDTSPDFDFVPTALRRIEEIERRNAFVIPKCINTGFPENAKVKRYKNSIPIFEKSTQQNQLFEFVKQSVGELDVYQMRNSYPEIFEVFDSELLSGNMKNEFVAICREIKENNPKQYKATLRRMRPIIENVLTKLNDTDENLIPKGYFKKGIPEISAIIHHLSGKPKFNKDTRELEYHAEQVLPEHISYLLNTLYDISSKVAMHDYSKEITQYVVKSCLFALLEFLVWFKNFYTNNYR